MRCWIHIQCSMRSCLLKTLFSCTIWEEKTIILSVSYFLLEEKVWKRFVSTWRIRVRKNEELWSYCSRRLVVVCKCTHKTELQLFLLSNTFPCQRLTMLCCGFAYNRRSRWPTECIYPFCIWKQLLVAIFKQSVYPFSLLMNRLLFLFLSCRLLLLPSFLSLKSR